MFDQSLQNVDLDSFLATAASNPQALVLSAYLEEKRKWEDKVKKLVLIKIKAFENIANMYIQIDNKKIKIIKIESENYNKGFMGLIYKTFNLSNKYEKKLRTLNNEILKIESVLTDEEEKYKKIVEENDLLMSNAPPAVRYELAMMGNNLFKPRQ